MLNAPPARYRIVEKNGRLIVYDRGVKVGSSITPNDQLGRPASALNPVATVKATFAQTKTPFSAVKSWPLLIIDQTAIGFIKLFSNGSDADGLIILTFRTVSGLKETKYTTRLTKEDACRLGRGALLLIAAASLLLLGIASGSGAIMFTLSLTAAGALATAFVGSGPTWEAVKWEKA